MKKSWWLLMVIKISIGYSSAQSNIGITPAAEARTSDCRTNLQVEESFLKDSWPGQKRQALEFFAHPFNPRLGNSGPIITISKFETPGPSSPTVKWAKTSNSFIMRGTGALKFSEYSVNYILAEDDQVHVVSLYFDIYSRDPKTEERLKSLINAELGAPCYVRNIPSAKFPRTITTWKKSANSPSRSIAYQLDATYQNNNDFYANGTPMKIALKTYDIGSFESFFFDHKLFTQNEAEIKERVSLLGLTYNKSQIGFNRFFGMAGQAKLHFAADNLEALQLVFGEDEKPEMNGRLYNASAKNPFQEAMRELISTRIRSFPTQSLNIQYNETPTVGLNSGKPTVGLNSRKPTVGLNSASTSGGLNSPNNPPSKSSATSSLLLGSQSFQNETKLAWSARGWEGNYFLTGRKLTAYRPGFDIAKVLNPGLGTLAGQSSLDRLSEDVPIQITGYDFALFVDNLRPHPEGGKYLPIGMIDQGETSLCFPAALTRILNYYNKNMVMEVVANQAGADAKMGTDLTGIKNSIKRMSETLNVFPFLAVDGSVKPVEFRKNVKESIDRGLPILWFIPDHARIINGYDLNKQEIIYTDSWGAGHEKDRMTLSEACRLNRFFLVLAPKEVLVPVKLNPR